MAMVTITSACNTILPNENNSSNQRGASFSSYLSTSEQTFILELSESARKPSSTFIDPQEPLHQISIGRKKTEDGEIDVFGAEKYFNGGMDEEEEEEKPRIAEISSRQHHQPRQEEEPVDLQRRRSKVKLGTPSTCSEASYNSRSALLSSRFIYPSPSKQSKTRSRRFFPGFACNCVCSDKKSVDIDYEIGEIKNSRNSKVSQDIHGVQKKQAVKIDRVAFDLVGNKQIQFKEEMGCQKPDKVSVGLGREECFSFPVFNAGVENLAIRRQFEEMRREEANPRKSLEVFGSPILQNGGVNLNLERKLSMLTWDAIPRAQNTTATSGSGRACDDMESDASSDLFEIENLSSNDNPFLMRQTSDAMWPLSSCATPTSCYEPSEASIEWSVVTASAANFSVASEAPSTITSDSDGMILKSTTTTRNETKTMATPKNLASKEVQRRGPGILLGCRSQKALNVAGNAHRVPADKATFEIRRCHRSESFAPPMSRFQAETKVTDYESAHAQRAFGTFIRSGYGRDSDSLYM
ncbi:PREDICTED: protein PHYTOCHROME KINASE SUBSTRATE 1-like [Nelumbo nucifera]|uniref:Protein PHYTOCHROME KINASE SUBSTRATE 1-like n=2 Tax=Nelumbo nucifera TaxID=4432 RepID=A0A822YJT8_NELNU|nr:PREDICTED: protein PHYTOCHROME KINASE SUBSTRATE 1-like [Nelumbo nucifera]DAD31235.1 TPA_asm: hypothetical protein HUJ06_010086 [Nelumbo nucifera]